MIGTMTRTPKQLIEQYLSEGKVVQMATANNNIPWICNVYYVVDNKLNIYWLSYPSRRHSIDIASNENVALTLAVKQSTPVIGVQAQGVASEVKNAAIVVKVMAMYIKKYGLGQNFYKNLNLKKNKHVLYRFSPSQLMLFDEQHFEYDSPQEIKL